MAKRRSSTPARRRGRSGKPRRSGFPWWRLLLLTTVIGAVALGGWTVWLDRSVRAQFEGKRWAVPATVYARALELYAGRPLTQAQLLQELDALNYRQTAGARGSGTWEQAGSDFLLGTRAFNYWDGAEPARRVRVSLSGGRVSTISDADSGGDIPLLRLDPARIGNIYPAHREDRLLVQLRDVPPSLVEALLVVEDRDFLTHWGISPSGILRAALANIRAGRVVQGGSTITQQLVKNFYLSSDQTLLRKVNEAIMAMLLEYRYAKGDILETYLNEVYLAQDRERSIHGIGLGAVHLFGEPLENLSLAQQALLVGMVKGPSFYDPRRHPQRATNRRNTVLRVMADTGVVSADTARAASAEPLGVVPPRQGARRSYPAFLELVQRHLQRDYRAEDLQSDGLRIFTTMAPGVQAATETALSRQLEGRPAELQAAVVMVDASSGEVLALAGGRTPGAPGFNRALNARRPIGSLIKPAVFLTALAEPARFGLGSILDDSPISLEDENRKRWEPRNFDREFNGDTLLINALAQSRNVPTVRLGLDMGLPAVRRTVDRLGAPLPQRVYPSFLLGTGELSPLEVAQMYQTLASGGFRAPLRSVREVTGQDGTPLRRYPISVTRVFEPEPVHLVNTALVSAMRTGTGRGAYRFLPESLTVAGKTGTTGDNRDSWFAGFGEELVGVVWLGRDDNTPTGLTGSTGALPVWADIMGQLQPVPLGMQLPNGLESLWIDGYNGQLSARGCEGVLSLPYMKGFGPLEATPCATNRQRELEREQERQMEREQALERERRRGEGRARENDRRDGGAAEWLRGLFR